MGVGDCFPARNGWAHRALIVSGTSDTPILHRVHFKLGQDRRQPIRGWEIISILRDIMCNHFIFLLRGPGQP